VFGDPLKGSSSGYPPTADVEKFKILRFTLHLKANKIVWVNSVELTNMETVQLRFPLLSKAVGASARDHFYILIT